MAAQLPIPTFASLADIYPSTSAVVREGQRWNELVAEFESRYGARPSHVVRAPGRVNILGEHIDYSLFDILIAVRARPSGTPTVRLANVLPKFRPTEFALVPPARGGKWDVGLVPPKDGGGWENYVKVAMLECLERFFPGGGAAAGMDLLVSGVVPPGAGLSSSAAFVVAGVITFLVANDRTDGISKSDVVELAMASEHRMGLRTGGMDQAASALCLSNSLLHLSFHPTLDPVPLPLPPSLAVVIADSLAPHALADSAPERYNLRVVEVLCAARLLLHAWGADAAPGAGAAESKDARVWLRQALEHWEHAKGLTDEQVYAKALEDVPRVLGVEGRDERGWTREEMVAASGMSADDFTRAYLDFVPVRAERFHLFKRARHTFEESLRVARFRAICESFATAPSADEADPRLRELGQLIDAAHASMRDLYEATVPEVDELQAACVGAGALGARQTGGGWGGAVISLVPVSRAPAFLETIRKTYSGYAGLDQAALAAAAFATIPGVGAGVYVVGEEI